MQLFIQFLKELGPVKIAITMFSAILMLALFGIYLYKASSKDYVVLFSDLDLSDSNSIVAELDSRNVPYEIVAGGSIIKVPDDRVLKLRLEMAQEGIPARGSIVGYEIFDKSESLSTSHFQQNINLVRALEGELSRTISSFDTIEKARVHLVIPKKELFSRERQEPRASVVLKLRRNGKPTVNEINAISHLVVTAVPNLDVKQITIVDTQGRPLKLGAQDENDPESYAGQTDSYRTSYENRLKHVIEDLLEQSVGVGKVKAYVSADLNFERIVTNSEIYDPEGQVVRSSQLSEENEISRSNNSNTDASVANNLPNNAGGGGNNQTGNSIERVDETTNYEISKTIKNHISATGTVKKLSIAVMVDGVYRPAAETGKFEYAPRSEEELAKYTNLVKSAVGFDEERNDIIEIINLQFVNEFGLEETEEPFDWLKQQLPNLVQTLVIAIVIVLILILVVRPIAIKAFDVKKTDVMGERQSKDHLSFITSEANKEEEENTSNEAEENMIDVEQIDAALQGNSSLKKLNSVVDNHPEETVSLMRKWLNED